MKKFVAASFVLVSCAAFAGEETGKVRFEHGQLSSGPNSAGYTFFYLEGGAKTGKPACATAASGERWVINNNWPAAKLQMSFLLAAATSGKSVTVRGSNDCTVWEDSETAANLFIVN